MRVFREGDGTAVAATHLSSTFPPCTTGYSSCSLPPMSTAAKDISTSAGAVSAKPTPHAGLAKRHAAAATRTHQAEDLMFALAPRQTARDEPNRPIFTIFCLSSGYYQDRVPPPSSAPLEGSGRRIGWCRPSSGLSRVRLGCGSEPFQADLVYGYDTAACIQLYRNPALHKSGRGGSGLSYGRLRSRRQEGGARTWSCSSSSAPTQ